MRHFMWMLVVAVLAMLIGGCAAERPRDETLTLAQAALVRKDYLTAYDLVSKISDENFHDHSESQLEYAESERKNQLILTITKEAKAKMPPDTLAAYQMAGGGWFLDAAALVFLSFVLAAIVGFVVALFKFDLGLGLFLGIWTAGWIGGILIGIYWTWIVWVNPVIWWTMLIIAVGIAVLTYAAELVKQRWNVLHPHSKERT